MLADPAYVERLTAWCLTPLRFTKQRTRSPMLPHMAPDHSLGSCVALNSIKKIRHRPGRYAHLGDFQTDRSQWVTTRAPRAMDKK
jgi:hypothetical protein